MTDQFPINHPLLFSTSVNNRIIPINSHYSRIYPTKKRSKNKTKDYDRLMTQWGLFWPLWVWLGSSYQWWPVWPAPCSLSPGPWLSYRSPWRRSSPCPWSDSLSPGWRSAGCCRLAWSRESQPVASAACSPSPEASCLFLAGNSPVPESCSGTDVMESRWDYF